MKIARATRLAAVLSAVAAVVTLASCVPSGAHSSDATVGSAIDEVLKAQTAAGIATVDLGHTVPGRWTKAMIACRGVTKEQLADVLGYAWDGPDVMSGSFLAMIVFFDSGKVDRFFSAGQDDGVVDHWYFTPCTRAKDPGLLAPIVLNRNSSRLTFTIDKSLADPHLYFWYVTPAELTRLGGELRV